MGDRNTKSGKTFICLQCGKDFLVSHSEVKCRPTIKFCSSECYHTSTRKPPQIRKCVFCGTEFVVKSKHKAKKFCGLKCANLAKRTRARVATLGADGYKYVWFSDGSGEKEHRYIMEQHLGRKLNRDEVVHHIDGNRANNVLSNLALMSRGEHSALHRRLEIDAGKTLFRSEDNANQ